MLFVISCKQGKQAKTVTASTEKINWADSLVMKYINKTDDSLIVLIRKDTITEEWILDRRENSDSAKYLVFQIGHSFEHNFNTDKWLCIDSLTRNIYEYDFATDSLIRWRK